MSHVSVRHGTARRNCNRKNRCRTKMCDAIFFLLFLNFFSFYAFFIYFIHLFFIFICLWIPTTDFEMKKFLGLLLWMGLVKVGCLKDYWSKDSLYNFSIPGKIMSRNRFQLLLSFMHFSDNNSIVPGDRLGKIKPLLDMLQMRYQRIYVPGENIVIDETLIPWRGRLLFRQYIPNKAHPYGIKLFKLCSTEGFTWSVKIYSGKSSSGLREVGLAKSVCEDLIIDLKGWELNFYSDFPW